MNEAGSSADIEGMTGKERIEYYEQQLKLITPPKSYRERVLINVFHYLLCSTIEREILAQESLQRRDQVDAEPFLALGNGAHSVAARLPHGALQRHIRTLSSFVMRLGHMARDHAAVASAVRR